MLIWLGTTSMNFVGVIAFFVSLILYVIILLQCGRMSDDLETVEDTKQPSLTEVTDESCTIEFIEILPIGTASDYCHTLGVIDTVVEVKPEDLLDIKQEPADENDEDPHYFVNHEHTEEHEIKSPWFTVQVRCMYNCIYSTDFCSNSSTICLCKIQSWHVVF